MGRPSDYSEELAGYICDELANGRSLVEICRDDEGLPDRRTVLRWMEKHSDFATKCARVRENGQADFVVDDMVRIERGVEAGLIAPDAARILISSKQWRAAKLAPKKYGDKTTVAGDPENPLQVVSITDADRAAALLAFMAKTKSEK